MAGGGVMDRVGLAPEIIGRQRQHTDHPADPIVCHAMTKKGAMPAIMLNHEQSHEEARGRHRKQQGDPPIFKMDRCPGRRPKRRKRRGRDRNLHDAADVVGLAIARKGLRPASRGCFQGR